MPKLRRLNGQEVIAILKKFDFSVVRIRGSHHRMKHTLADESQTISVPVHGNKPLSIGTLRSIYRHACQLIGEDDLYPYFYAE